MYKSNPNQETLDNTPNQTVSTKAEAQTANQYLDLAVKYYNVVLSLGLLVLAFYLNWNILALLGFAISLLLFVPVIKIKVDSVISEGVKKVIAGVMAIVAAITGFFGINNQEPVQNPPQNTKALTSQNRTTQNSLSANKIKSPTANQNRNNLNQNSPIGYIDGSCEDLKAQGISNITKDDPNYTSQRDKDGDGFACEN